jgi:hypothetical protein
MILFSLSPFDDQVNVGFSIRKAIDWLKQMRLDNGSWHDDPWETMLSVSALLDYDLQYCTKSIAWLKKFKYDSHILLNRHYTVQYCIILLKVQKHLTLKHNCDTIRREIIDIYHDIVSATDTIENDWRIAFYLDFLNELYEQKIVIIDKEFEEKILTSALFFLKEASVIDKTEVLIPLIQFFKTHYEHQQSLNIENLLQKEVKTKLLSNLSEQVLKISMKKEDLVTKKKIKYLFFFYFTFAIIIPLLVGISLIRKPFLLSIDFVISIIITIILTTFLQSSLRETLFEIFKN